MANAFKHLLIPVGTVCTGLGVWQTRRKFEKEEMLQKIDLQRNSDSVLMINAEKLKSTEILDKINFLKVGITGKFLHDQEILVGPRSLFDPETGISTGRKKGEAHTDENSTYGNFVVTPFLLEDGKTVILVNRGWLDDELSNQSLRDLASLPASKDATTLFGYFRQVSDKTPRQIREVHEIQEDHTTPIVFRKTSQKNHNRICQYLEENFPSSQSLEYIPVCIDEDHRSPNKNYRVIGTPIGSQTNLDIPNNHLGYLLQWFGLAFVCFYWRATGNFGSNATRTLQQGLKNVKR